MSTPNQPESPGLPTRVMLEISLLPALPVETVKRLAQRAEAEGVTMEALIIRTLGKLVASEPQPVAA